MGLWIGLIALRSPEDQVSSESSHFSSLSSFSRQLSAPARQLQSDLFELSYLLITRHLVLTRESPPPTDSPSTMAIHPIVRDERPAASNLTQQDISAWTEQAAASLQILDISDSVAQVEVADGIRGTSTALSIPLDGPIVASTKPSVSRVKIVSKSTDETIAAMSSTYRRREPLRRDSLKRREALLKGKEGSRRRQRWENGI